MGILVSGTVDPGSKLAFYPSVPKLRAVDGGQSIYTATQWKWPNAEGYFAINLMSGDEFVTPTHQLWRWICVEWSAGRRVAFAFSSAPGELQYAEVRTLGVGL